MSIPPQKNPPKRRSRSAAPEDSARGAASPIYSRIQDSIRQDIRFGRYKPGDKLPSENELCQSYNTTRPTVRHALSRLVFEGTIIRKAGRGSFVAKARIDKFPIDTRECLSFEEQVAMEGRRVTYRSPSLSLVAAPQEVARDLRLETEGEVFFLDRLRVIDERPVCLERRYMHPEIGRHVTGDMLLGRSAHSFVSEIVGARIPAIRVLVSAIVANAEISDRLSTPVGAALIVRDNWHIDATGRILMCGRSLFPGDIRTEYFLGKTSGMAKTVIPFESAKT